MEILKVRENCELAYRAAEWFHSKWGIPVEAYEESINECLEKKKSVPQWYAAFENGEMIGGVGVIENDFHNRKDLTPNVCALYVEKEYRCKGIAGKLLQCVCDDMNSNGIDTLYLITDHTSFYERYGWKFLCMVQGDGEPDMTRMYIHKM
ncbi:GNAT family N-acetyltransferase [Clostridium sp. MCC353]|uniref:GNAT family N-acetyltransferase n=1 Tax=Clostridium sp. MCC353 TaxID=2592646 RepID=UPI001C01D451|nr:GNAT family N-acetyltransferase [Clostridium sp. MCC353]MBT9776108.1 GNAT family N-acetyltransferase [Clostridium sp. MCC353]